MTDRRAYYKARRDQLRGGPARTLEPCGTWAAVIRHYRHGETLDAKCEQARREHNRKMYERRKGT